MTIDATPVAVLTLGFVLGLRHALDVDHLAAVSTMLADRRGVLGASLTGALWGLGHTVALLAVALLVVAFHAEIRPAVARALELGVAAMLVGLGVNLLLTLRRGGRVHVHVHAHRGRAHVHPHVHGAGEVAASHHALPGARKPFLVGCMHGLAGSGGLMIAVLATIPSPPLALAYVLTFGAGSIGGMVAMSLLLGAPLALAAERFAGAERAVRACAAVASVGVGLVLAWQVGVDVGLIL